MFIANLQDSIAQVEEVQQELESSSGLPLQPLLEMLNKAICICELCSRHLNPQAAQQVSLWSHATLDRLKPNPRGEDVEDDPTVGNGDEEAPEDNEAVSRGPTDLEQSAAQVYQPYHVKDWSQAVMGHYPCPLSAPDMPPLD